MNDLQIKGNWDQLKGKLKQRYSDLTDDDLKFLEGKYDELLGKLEEKTGQNKQDLKQEIEEEIEAL